MLHELVRGSQCVQTDVNR